MIYLLDPIIVLLIFSHGSATQVLDQTSMEYQSTPRSIQDDLKLLNLSCEQYDSCAQRICDSVFSDSLNFYGCHCGPYCVLLDTCCLDSNYIGILKPKVRPTCRLAHNGGAYFMMDRCPSSDSTWEGLCREEWNGEDDIFKIMPVTSLQTSMTYKNYFCFKCHEENEDFIHWTVSITSNAISEGYNASNESISLKYDNNENTWMAVIGDYNDFSFPVNISIKVPRNIAPLVRDCKVDVISNCSEHWTDKKVLDKCERYTAMKQTFRDGWTFIYRNMHCATCNFETIDNFSCSASPSRGSVFSTFSFTHLLDINRRDGDIVGRIQKCKEDYVWDPYAEKCRKLTCALPGYTVQNGKCVPE